MAGRLIDGRSAQWGKGDVMKQYLLLIGALMIFSLAQAADLTISVGGKDNTAQYRVLEREISEKDRNTGSQHGAQECSLLYYSLLAKGDIQAASQLATDPAAAADLWRQYRERLGAADFQKEMADYFTVKNRVIAEIAFADEVMLLVKTPEYMAGQIYRQKDGKYFVVTGKAMSEASRVLGKALNMFKEGKIQLK
jgi:hypothetical protein